MKSAPIKILCIIFVTSLICVLGEILLYTELDRLSNHHELVMNEYVQNREYMAQIKTLMYEHQALLGGYLLNKDIAVSQASQTQEQELREQLKELIISFSYRMKGGEREPLYHKVYSDYAGYESSVDMLIQFWDDGDYETALYYNNQMLRPFLADIDANLDILDEMTIQEIEDAESAMQATIRRSAGLRNAVIVFMVVMLLICTVICVGITANLDRYKVTLEKELEEKNQKLREGDARLIKLQDGIIIGMANLIESRNGETGEHVKRTAKYVEMIAEACVEQHVYSEILTVEYIDRLKKAAPLHDVGKICVSDQILLKPGRLTPEEFEQIKLHAAKGGEIIRECFAGIDDQEYVSMAIDVASFHHEKWNGEGYCAGLSGEDIPLSARIMAIADVFDALISKRCYKEAFPISEAFDIIRQSAGSHFDPRLTEVFLSMQKQIEESL